MLLHHDFRMSSHQRTNQTTLLGRITGTSATRADLFHSHILTSTVMSQEFPSFIASLTFGRAGETRAGGAVFDVDQDEFGFRTVRVGALISR
mmetsp:Transcript_12084/g.25523  ORF Transcript_12084/g.25523 Transcript_12084/m.25523 type:complete len:92 (+) Transcript_12084:124-399(+)